MPKTNQRAMGKNFPYKKRIAWNKGKKETRIEVLKKLSESHKGYKPTLGQRRKLSEANKGEKSYLWKGGITLLRDKIRKGVRYCLWKELVFRRDNFICQSCGKRGGDLNAHHIQNFAEYPELRLKIENGTTLHKNCHRDFHKKYGTKNNNRLQFLTFIDYYDDRPDR